MALQARGAHAKNHFGIGLPPEGLEEAPYQTALAGAFEQGRRGRGDQPRRHPSCCGQAAHLGCRATSKQARQTQQASGAA